MKQRLNTCRAVDLLVRATAGVPRSVCLLARASWLEAAQAQTSEITAQTMQLAMEQVPDLTGNRSLKELLVYRNRPGEAILR